MQSSSSEIPRFRNLKITGHTYIEAVPSNERLRWDTYRYLIMGPTGAGKSTFIEALSEETQNLEISKDQLAGYTQSVTAYQLMNVEKVDHSVYLVDTPGFCDSKISETEIMNMIRDWLEENQLTHFHTILFLTPITAPRLAGSKWRTMEMLKAFLKPYDSLHSTIFVTTMWHQLYSKQAQQRADANFAQLKNEMIKEFIDRGAGIEKFSNTRNSALQILDNKYARDDIVFSEVSVSNALLHLYQDLYERIQGALQQKRTLESELASSEAQTNVSLRSLLETSHMENEETLNKFAAQFVRFGAVPASQEEGYERLKHVLEPHPWIRLFDQQPGETHLSNAHLDDLYFDLMERQCTDTTHLTISTPERRTTSSQDAIVEHSPTSLVQINPTRMLTLKGLLRRLIRAAKRRGKKWFMKRKD